MTENQLATKILDKAFIIHRSLGPGLLESVYERALAYELMNDKIDIQCQLPIPLTYKEVYLEAGYRLDILVQEKVLVEVKAIDKLLPIHYAQTLTYLKLKNLKLGLLINFNSKLLKNGIHRVVNGL